MMFNGEIDGELDEHLQTVNWFRVSELQAQSLGISLNLYQEAVQEGRLSDQLHRSNVTKMLAITLVLIVAVVLKASALMLVTGTIAMLVASALLTRYQCSVNSSLINIQRKALLVDIQRLAALVPSPKQELASEDIDVDVDEESGT